MTARSRRVGAGAFLIASVVFLPALAGIARGDVKVRQVTLKKVVPPDIRLPAKVKRIGFDSFKARDVVKKALPYGPDMFKAVLEETFLKRAPKFKIVDIHMLLRRSRGDFNVVRKAVDLSIRGELKTLEAVPGEEGKRLTVRLSGEAEGMLMEDGFMAFKKIFSEEIVYELKKGEARTSVRRRAFAQVFRKAAEKLVLMLAGDSKMEKTFLLEAGPLTSGAIVATSKGDLVKARAMFKQASESEEERNSGFFGLYVLCRFAGKHDEAEAFLKKAGE